MSSSPAAGDSHRSTENVVDRRRTAGGDIGVLSRGKGRTKL